MVESTAKIADSSTSTTATRRFMVDWPVFVLRLFTRFYATKIQVMLKLLSGTLRPAGPPYLWDPNPEVGEASNSGTRRVVTGLVFGC